MVEENTTKDGTNEEVVTRRPAKRPHFTVWSPLVDKRTVIQQKGGAIIIGVLIGQRDGFFVLEDAALKGRKYKLQPGRILVERTSVAHMHEECPLELITE